jgi:cell division protein FtsL
VNRTSTALVLGVLLLATALGVVWTRHESRVLFVELQELNGRRDELNIEWGRLQLEQATWAEASRIERLAREKLNMQTPEQDDMVVIVR